MVGAAAMSLRMQTKQARADLAIVLREVAEDGPNEERIVEMMADEILHIGRSSKLPYPRILFPKDPEMSSRHATVIPKFRSKRRRSVDGNAAAEQRSLDTRAISVKDLSSLNGEALRLLGFCSETQRTGCRHLM
jgi:esterase/lipase superfamily enzyme